MKESKMFSLPESQTTMIAAIIAAVTSLMILIFQIFENRFSERRTAYRAAITPHLVPLGKTLHEMLAKCKISMKKKGDKTSSDDNMRDSKELREEIERIRYDVRYLLPGMDEALKVIGLTPSFIEHFKRYPENADKLFKYHNKLRAAIDFVVIKCFYGGRPPRFYERLWIWHHTKNCRDLYSSIQSQRNEGREKLSSLLKNE